MKKYLILLIVVVGFFLRVWGISFGLPFQFHQDEPIVVNHALAYGAGDLNPHFFAIPPLTSYFLFAVYILLFLSGLVAGLWSGTQEFALQFFRDPSIFYLVGRFFVGVLPGTISIYLLYDLSRRFMSRSGACFAAAVMAFCFLNVVNSHYIYTDSMLVMTVIWAMSSIYSMFKKGRGRDYIISGALIGLSMGVKYNAVLLVLPFFVTHLLVSFERKRSVFSRDILLASIAACFAFILTNPFMILDYAGFLTSTKHQSGAFWFTGWGHHFLYSLVEGISWPLALCGLAGSVFVVMRLRWGSVLFSFWGPYYMVLIFKSQHFARYVLPLIPFAAIGCGYLLFDIILPKFRNNKVRNAFVMIAALLLLPTLGKSIAADILFSSTDTRIEAAKWIKENLTRGTKIACDSTNFRPAIKQPYSQLLEKENFLDGQEGLGAAKRKKMEMLLAVSDKDDPGYPLYFMFDFPDEQGQFLDTLPAISFSLADLRARDIQYVSINGQLSGGGKDLFLEDLLREGQLVAEFTPYDNANIGQTKDPTATTCIPIASKDLFLRSRLGPMIRIYRIK